MSNRKRIFHIEVESEKTSLVWSLLSENLKLVVYKKQHSTDGKTLKIYIALMKIENNHR